MTTLGNPGRLLSRQVSRSRPLIGSKFTPLSLPGIAAWYSGQLGVTDAGSGKVSDWADQTVNARHLSQATALRRPTTGTRTQNGLNGIDFNNAATEWMSNATDFMATGTDPVTFYAVTECDEGASATASRLWSASSASDGRYFYRRNAAGGPYTWNAQDGDAISATGWGTGVKIMAGTDTNGAQHLQVNGTTVITDTKARGITAGTAFFVGVFSDSASNPYNGVVYELIMCNALHSAGLLSYVVAYLNRKYVVF